jgi:hypothetical protein
MNDLLPAWRGTPHFSQHVTEYLNEHIPARWIGRGGPQNWPLRSPDLLVSTSRHPSNQGFLTKGQIAWWEPSRSHSLVWTCRGLRPSQKTRQRKRKPLFYNSSYAFRTQKLFNRARLVSLRLPQVFVLSFLIACQYTFAQKMAIALFAETLDTLQHTMRLIPESRSSFAPWTRILEKLTRSFCPEIFPLLWYAKVRYRLCRRPPLVPILSQVNPIQSSKPYFPKIHFNITLSSAWSPLHVLQPTFCTHFESSPCALHASPISSSLIWSS